MTVPTLTVQPIHFTSNYQAWKEFYQQLGMRQADAHEFYPPLLAADSGQLMLAEVEAGSDLDGLRLIEFTVADLQAYAAALEEAGVPVNRVELAHRDGLAVDLPMGRVHICQSPVTAGAAPFDPYGLNFGALLFAPAKMVTPAAVAIAQYGLTPRVASDDGGWTDLIGHGFFAFHDGTHHTVHHEAPHQPVVGPCAETGDVDAMAERLVERGLEPHLIDEAYGRSIHVNDPDGELSFVINETMKDFYGYRRLDT